MFNYNYFVFKFDITPIIILLLNYVWTLQITSLCSTWYFCYRSLHPKVPQSNKVDLLWLAHHSVTHCHAWASYPFSSSILLATEDPSVSQWLCCEVLKNDDAILYIYQCLGKHYIYKHHLHTYKYIPVYARSYICFEANPVNDKLATTIAELYV